MPRVSTTLAAALLLLAGLAAVPAPTGAAPQGLVAPCEGFQFVPYQGPSCPLPGGGWRVLLGDGSSVETHGGDYVAHASKNVNGKRFSPTTVSCVKSPESQFHNVLVYAVPSDRIDRSAEIAPQLRDMAAQANGLLYQESSELGSPGRYKFRCDSPGTPTVLVARLSSTDAAATFASIVGEIRGMGLNSTYAKHWVYYEGTRGDLIGQATLRFNDKLTSANGNAKGNDFAIVYGVLDPVAFMHENGHNMGAVQRSAPHTTNLGHCTDGQDVMCYQDGGAEYHPSMCADRIHFDCNHDDYFHPNPAPGSYLATSWNVAGPLNRFLDFGRPNMAPVIPPITCAPAVVDFDQVATCTVIADDDSDGIAYTVSWDGAPAQRIPADGSWLIAGNPLVLTNAWPTYGEHVLTVTPIDNGGTKGLTGAPTSVTVRVGCALERSGEIIVSISAAPSAWERNVPRACADHPFSLTSSLGADLDLCWHDAAGLNLGCHENIGDESGTIPSGASSARLWIKAGTSSAYRLHGG